MRPRQVYDPGKQHMTPGNRYTHIDFIDSDLIYSHKGKWGGGCKICRLSLAGLYK